LPAVIGDTGADPKALQLAFSITLLGICNRTKDPTYQPVVQARAIAEQARRIVGDDPTIDFAKAVTVFAAGSRGKEEIDADAAFVQSANAVCQRDGKAIKPLLNQVMSMSLDFKSGQAAVLNARLTALAADVTRAAQHSTAKNARSFARSYRKSVRRIGALVTRYGQMAEHPEKVADMALVGGRVQDHAVKLSVATGDIEKCGDGFSGI
jgi:hypothetical protein